ncbi:hypothetical protein BGZ72_009034 [Mortierella alpina]|nr:hypothetical protein BGZ72_009034 [Mortierella alpina]
MDPFAKHGRTQHPVIDTLEQTRLDQHEGPFPHPHVVHAATASAHPLEHVGADVTDQILQQAEAVPLAQGSGAQRSEAAAPAPAHLDTDADRRAGASSAPLKPMSPGMAQKSNPTQQHAMDTTDTPARRLSTTATLPSATWQPLASKSSNQLPSKTIVDTAHSNSDAAAMMHEHEHDRPSVLPEIVPGFRGRLADIHHATLNSVKGVTGAPAESKDGLPAGGNGHETGVTHSDQQQHQASENKVQGSQWTGGTMFPAMTGFNPFSYNSSNNTGPPHQRRLSASEEAHRKLSKSSILYESSDLAESTTQLTDDDYVGPTSAGTGTSVPASKTLVQGGQGGRRWSHELSPEKAGLVGSMIEAAGLIKDVVIDKIESTDAHLRRNNHHTLSPEERQEAARVAFGGSEETGDQTVYLEKLQDHLRREHVDKARAAAAVAAGGGDGGSPTSSRTSTTTTADVLSSAPHAGEEHRKSIFHLAANPEVKKSLLLDHPEALGYHARDPTLAPLEESTLAAQHRLAGNNAASPQDVSKTRR